ncbi:hypothetical protein [Clostridium celatum]|uniref:hypothetical protein n=1 Tax=Clostridium celatum TaxID=36834 RepID=UPI001897CF08|nr:hypothetical protein [Clostridium celatum]
MKNMYEPKIKFNFVEGTPFDVNSSMEDIIKNLNPVNLVDGLKLLKEIYFISYKGMASIFGCSGSAFRTAINYGSFTGIIKDESVEEGILNLQYHFLQDTFPINVEIEE